MAFQLNRRVLLTGGVATACAAAFDVWSGQDMRVAHYTRPMREGLSQPLRVAFLSDPHVIEPWFSLDVWRQVIEQTNALNPDLIIMGGDYSGYNIKHWSLVYPGEIARVSARARAPLGVYAIMGNHDHTANDLLGGTWQGQPAMTRAFRDVGIMMLNNEAQRLEHFGRPFWLAGVDSHAYFYEDGSTPMNLDKTLASVSDDAPVLLAAHEPDVFARHHPRVDIQLSGHMHAGQVRIASYAPAPMPSRYGTRYLHGLIEEEGKAVIVSSGLGYSRLPVRLGAMPEIVLLDTFV